MALPGLPQKPAEETVNGPMEAQMRDMVERFRTVLADLIETFDDPRDALSCAMSAGIVFAGAQAGTLIGMGDFQESDAQFEQFNRMIEINFAAGVKLGKLKTAQVIAKTGRAN